MIEEESTVYNVPAHIAYGLDRTDIETVQQDVEEGLESFFSLAKKYNLPTHNAVAFFTKLIELEQSKKHSKADLREILRLALSGRGFVFGTAFDLERNAGLRPCDLYNKSGVEEIVDAYALWNHAQLKGGLLFRKDYKMIDRDIQELAYQAQVVADWQKEIVTAQDTQPDELRFKKDDLKAFLSIFEWYSMEQLKVSGTEPNKKDPKAKRVTEELEQIKTVSLSKLQLLVFL